MKRAIITPAVLAPTALAELKDNGLASPPSADDAPLTALLRTALETVRELSPARCRWPAGLRGSAGPLRPAGTALATRPVQAIAGLSRDCRPRARALPWPPMANYAVELDADGGGRVRVYATPARPDSDRGAVHRRPGRQTGTALPDSLCATACCGSLRSSIASREDADSGSQHAPCGGRCAVAALAPVAVGMSAANFDALAARLIERARLLGEAAAETARTMRRDPASAWRNARLLWPNCSTKE
jgi:hypothetical protein